MERTESGTLWLSKSGLKKPGKMRWEYRSPREKLFVSDGTSAWFYVPGDRQARKTDARKLDDIVLRLHSCWVRASWKRSYRGCRCSGCGSAGGGGRGAARRAAGYGRPCKRDFAGDYARAPDCSDCDQRVDGSTTEYSFSDQKENVAIRMEI